MTSLNNRLATTIDLAECIDAMLKDVASNYPTDQLEFTRDSKRVFQQSKSRGLAFFTLDLPELAKALDASLARERLDLLGLPHSRGSKRGSMIPRLFKGLWLRIFDLDGCLRVDADETAVYFLRSLLMVGKKLKLEAPQSALFKVTKEFFQIEDRLPRVPDTWDDATPVSRLDLGHLTDLDRGGLWGLHRREYNSGHAHSLLTSVQRVADRVAGELGFFDPKLVVGRHGPGAVAELPRSKYKYDFGKWSPNLEGIFDYEDFATANLSFVEDSLSSLDVSFSEEASRLIPVPKTMKGPRLIAAEPISNQWIQQGVSRLLRDKVRHTVIGSCIDFFDQYPSQEAALEASRDGRRATIDLKSASDSLSCYVVQRMFRGNTTLFNMLRACRTRFLLNTIDSKFQTLLRLRKFATMGSALTFPIQSIVFATICLGVGAAKHPRRSLRTLAREVRVFGDDLIVPVEWVPDLVAVFELLGLVVNSNKTFWTGKFRESCGIDAFRGVDVTPPYLRVHKRVALGPDGLSSWVDVSNNFHIKGWWHTAAWMIRSVPQLRQVPVVHVSSGMPGLATFNMETWNDDYRYDEYRRPHPHGGRLLQSSRDRPRVMLPIGGMAQAVPVRWNNRLQRWEVRVLALYEKERSDFSGSGTPAVLLEWFTRREQASSSPASERLVRADLSRLGLQGNIRENVSSNLRHLEFRNSRLGRIVGSLKKPTAGTRPLVSGRWVSLAAMLSKEG